MSKQIEIFEDEMIDIIVKRANKLRGQNFYLLIETQIAIDRVQEALDNYKAMFEQHQIDYPQKK